MGRSPRKAALITGAARRIGRSVALALADRAYDVALHCNRSVEEAEELKSRIELSGCRCEIFRADLSCSSEVTGLLDRVRRLHTGLELLVNNASIFEPGTLVETELGLWERHLNINLKAPFLLMRDFARSVNRGQIVNILDTRVFGTPSGYVAYSVSKSALWSLSRMAALELAPTIRVNAIAPGLILPPPGEDSMYLERMAPRVPLKRAGSPGNIVQALVYLLDSEFVTGECLMVDGGQWLG